MTKLMDHLVGQNKMTEQERQSVLDIRSRIERVKMFLRNLKDQLSSVKLRDMIQGLKTTGQTDIANRLQDNSVCIGMLLLDDECA